MSVEGGEHWSEVRERGDVAGMRFLYGAYMRAGRWAFSLLLGPVVAYFWLTAGAARRASREYLSRVRKRLDDLGRPPTMALTTLRHFFEFGRSVLDKSSMWGGSFRGTVEFDDPDVFRRFRESGRGALFIGSHLGNLEALRGYADADGLKVNALVFSRSSPKLGRFAAAIGPRAFERMIEIDTLGPESVIRLQDKIRAGEHIAIAADRVSVRHKERSIHVPFLGEPAPFPEGPFILASLLACPVYLLFCVADGKGYRVYIEPFADPLTLPRNRRRETLERLIAQYAQRLEAYCLLAPTQWFNFFDFWKQAGGAGRTKMACPRTTEP
jgi:predicted LPLAT superfamily acyltransferase